MAPDELAEGRPQRLRLILHAGFHKTGTTTVQRCLQDNQPLLSPHLRIFLRNDMLALCEAARRWSATRNPVDFALFQFECAVLLEALDADDPRPVLLASEDLSGHMPGRHGLKDYGAAPLLMKCIQDTVLELQPAASICIFYMTRSAPEWLQSCHVQHLRASPLTLDAEEYVRQYAASADLQAIVSGTAQLSASAKISSAPLEAASAHRLGPISALLPHLGLPAAAIEAMKPVPPANTRPEPEILEELLALNRSGQPYSQIRIKKQAVLRRSRVSKRPPV
ncbi:hypothetical protein [Leisingera sp.]|uniref:hypothetical protein n=1 Tax=Leisingera sp. TaxID=1879318 RepID=UPI002B26F7B8|nr:hypothetical protein [Leisingera sp.]